MRNHPDKKPHYNLRRTALAGTLAVSAALGIDGAYALKNNVTTIQNRYDNVRGNNNTNPLSPQSPDYIQVKVRPGQTATDIGLEFDKTGGSNAANITLSVENQDPTMHPGDVVNVPKKFADPELAGPSADIVTPTPAEQVPLDVSIHHQQ